MSTLDNINENIINKIDYIDKINDIIFYKYKLNLFIFQYDKENIDINEFFYLINDLGKIYNFNNTININHLKNDYKTFFKYLHILIKKYLKYLKIKNIYESQSILFLTEYYSITQQKDDYLNNNYNNNIYNDNIFLLSNNNSLNTILDTSDLLELKNIYYQNYYQYKYFKLPIKKHLTNNNHNKLSKVIYNKFNMFILSEDIYGIFDNYLEYLSNFINIYKETIYTILNNIDNSISIDLNYDKLYKKMINYINLYNKSKLIYNIDEINYDICTCGNKMIIQANTSELLCIKCGEIHTLIGSVFEDSQFYNQEGNRYKHGSYDPNRHCKFWIDRIQAKENTVIEDSVIEKIKNCIKKDKIENIKNISIEQFRLYLKQTNLSKLNDHIPLIKKIITGYIPPQLNHNELHLLFNYFDKATKTYEIIKPKEKSNSLYYPFLIYKIIDLIIDDNNKKRELLACIHLQSYETLIDNDKIWFQICKHNDNFVYKPTDKLNIY